jgi:hypothetical protein
MTNRNRQFHQNSAHMLVALRFIAGPPFASKQSRVIAMLQSPAGATIVNRELMMRGLRDRGIPSGLP